MGWGLAIAVVVAAAVFGLLLFLHRPEGQFFYPRCSFHETTGWLCPGCGGLRSVHALMHGRLAEAARCNALFVVGSPLLAAWWMLIRVLTGSSPTVGQRSVWALFAISMVFTVVRNLPLPASSWLVP